MIYFIQWRVGTDPEGALGRVATACSSLSVCTVTFTSALSGRAPGTDTNLTSAWLLPSSNGTGPTSLAAVASRRGHFFN